MYASDAEFAGKVALLVRQSNFIFHFILSSNPYFTTVHVLNKLNLTPHPNPLPRGERIAMPSRFESGLGSGSIERLNVDLSDIQKVYSNKIIIPLL